jgi:enamine deaminase RidA (YjgF/YER057c/UK114 family)
MRKGMRVPLNVYRRGGQEETAQVTRVTDAGLAELYIAVHPTGDPGNFLAQARSAYLCLFECLKAEGATPGDLVSEKFFFSEIDSQFELLESIRREAYRNAGIGPENRPAVTFLHQPPCYPNRECELQAHAVVGQGQAAVNIRAVSGLPGLASGRTVEYEGDRHVHILNVPGAGEADDVSFAEEARRMFERSEACLGREGASYSDVVRTWIYLADIERDYDAFNPVRTGFFDEKRLDRIPASTGIQGATFPRRRACTMDLYALLPGPDTVIRTMHSSTMSEAPTYGSAFSRGTTVSTRGRVKAYVSGTASIDERGNVAHVGDIEGQVHRALNNIDALLKNSGGDLNDVVSMISYLKDPRFRDAFASVWVERGLSPTVPNTLALADVCRPEWLCELEAIAVFPELPT